MKLQQVKLYQKVFVAKLTIRHSHTPFFGAREGAKLDILNWINKIYEIGSYTSDPSASLE